MASYINAMPLLLRLLYSCDASTAATAVAHTAVFMQCRCCCYCCVHALLLLVYSLLRLCPCTCVQDAVLVVRPAHSVAVSHSCSGADEAAVGPSKPAHRHAHNATTATNGRHSRNHAAHHSHAHAHHNSNQPSPPARGGSANNATNNDAAGSARYPPHHSSHPHAHPHSTRPRSNQHSNQVAPSGGAGSGGGAGAYKRVQMQQSVAAPGDGGGRPPGCSGGGPVPSYEAACVEGSKSKSLGQGQSLGQGRAQLHVTAPDPAGKLSWGLLTGRSSMLCAHSLAVCVHLNHPSAYMYICVHVCMRADLLLAPLCLCACLYACRADLLNRLLVAPPGLPACLHVCMRADLPHMSTGCARVYACRPAGGACGGRGARPVSGR